MDVVLPKSNAKVEEGSDGCPDSVGGQTIVPQYPIHPQVHLGVLGHPGAMTVQATQKSHGGKICHFFSIWMNTIKIQSWIYKEELLI